ncbi:MAG: OsmC family protein [Vampirovibrionales bacterium]|nr:OsmC family protein [Vampirovibrionales bacterium]
MQATITLNTATPFQSTTSFGPHNVTLDVPDSLGGGDTGPSPHQMLLTSLGSCTAITVAMYATRKEWPLERVEVSVSHADHKAETPIEKTITLIGNLDGEQRERLHSIAEKCPINLLLKGTVTVNSHLA